MQIKAILLVALLGLSLNPAKAADYPSRPVKVIIPIPAGGASDILARVVADRLSARLGQTFVPENRGGANGQIGLNMLSRSAPDGYTIGVAATTHLVIPVVLQSKTQYDPQKGFALIGRMATSGSFIAVNPSLPVHNVAELVALAKREPKKLFFATPGIGSTMHLLGELFNQTAGTEIVHVPFKGGGPAASAVIGDSGVAVGMFTTPSAISFVAGGQLRPLAVFDNKRDPDLPNVPALTETFPGLDIPVSWYALVAPAGLPKDIAARLSKEMTEALNEPAVKERLKKLGFDAAPSSPEQLKEIIQHEIAIWKPVTERADIKIP